jgi:hypothetical protein
MRDIKEANASKYTCKSGGTTIEIAHSAPCSRENSREKERSSIHRWSLLPSVMFSAPAIVYPKARLAVALNSR